MRNRQRPDDLDDFRNALEQGRHPDGHEVKAAMPRWQMNGANLADPFAFLEALPA